MHAQVGNQLQRHVTSSGKVVATAPLGTATQTFTQAAKNTPETAALLRAPRQRSEIWQALLRKRGIAGPRQNVADVQWERSLVQACKEFRQRVLVTSAFQLWRRWAQGEPAAIPCPPAFVPLPIQLWPVPTKAMVGDMFGRPQRGVQHGTAHILILHATACPTIR